MKSVMSCKSVTIGDAGIRSYHDGMSKLIQHFLASTLWVDENVL